MMFLSGVIRAGILFLYDLEYSEFPTKPYDADIVYPKVNSSALPFSIMM